MPQKNLQQLSFIAVTLLITAACIWVVLPFYGAVLWAAILAILFRPLHRRLLRHIGNHNLAAAISLFGCIVLAIIPAIVVLTALVQETTGLYNRLSNREFDLVAFLDRMHDALPAWVLQALADLDLAEYETIRARLTALTLQSSQFFANQLLAIGQGTMRFALNLGVMLYLLFFLFRDGPAIALRIRGASPLSPQHTDHILNKFTAVMRATVQGNFTISILQGGIGGVAFWFLGIEPALLWAALMAILSLLPAVGAFLVWMPVAVYLLLSGSTIEALALTATGVILMGGVEYLLRPALIGKGARLPDYAILISTLGGIAVMGLNGFVIGPLIAALFVSVWSLYSVEQMHG